MRYGVIADIHGNLPALRAALDVLERQGVDRYLCLGDLVGYGAFPNECVERIAELDAVCVAGNHDLIALGRLSDTRCIELARRSLRWTRERLRQDVIDYLGRLPLQARVGRVVLAHGSLDDPQEYTTRLDQATSQLARLADGQQDSGVLLLGHTHRAWAATHREAAAPPVARPLSLDTNEWWLLNPGAVGQSREREVHARFMLLDVGALEARFCAVAYDVEGYVRALRASGLPAGSYHLPPSRLGRLRRRLRELRARPR